MRLDLPSSRFRWRECNFNWGKVSRAYVFLVLNIQKRRIFRMHCRLRVSQLKVLKNRNYRVLVMGWNYTLTYGPCVPLYALWPIGRNKNPFRLFLFSSWKTKAVNLTNDIITSSIFHNVYLLTCPSGKLHTFNIWNWNRPIEAALL